MRSILIESKNAGWKFTCKNHNIDIETGLYFGIKNKYLENKNILLLDQLILKNKIFLGNI